MDVSDFYSRDLWKHSPVYNSFVKLFIKDILALQSSPNERISNFTKGDFREREHSILVKSSNSMDSNCSNSRCDYAKGKYGRPITYRALSYRSDFSGRFFWRHN